MILVASSLIAVGNVQAQVDQQKNEVIQDNRSDRAEQRSERRENRAGRRDQRKENRTANKGRTQRASTSRASGGRRK